MKGVIFFFIASLNCTFGYSQLHTGSFANENLAHSLLRQIESATNDTARVELLNSLGDYYAFIRQDSSIFYLGQSIELAEKINYPYGSYSGYSNLRLC
jgi:hypothetical protein